MAADTPSTGPPPVPARAPGGLSLPAWTFLVLVGIGAVLLSWKTLPDIGPLSAKQLAAFVLISIGAALAQQLEILGHAALFHDIGKIAIPDAVLMKPGELSPSERAVMQIHSNDGAEIVSRLGFLADAVPAIRHHHENFDGTGYPARLSDTEIPLGARIIRVADALDAMMNARVYRPGRELGWALEELRRMSGTHFCPRCVDAAVAVAERDTTVREMLAATG